MRASTYCSNGMSELKISAASNQEPSGLPKEFEWGSYPWDVTRQSLGDGSLYANRGLYLSRLP